MTKTIFVLPASYTGVIHAFLECLGLLFALYVGVASHSDVLLETHCGSDHYEFWPSISTTIGDVQPERQIWRGALLLSFPFRVCCLISIFCVFWFKGSKGLQGLHRAPNESICSFFFNSSILSLLMLFCDVARSFAAFVWTLVASAERLDMHNAGFIIFIVLSELFHICSTVLTWRNRRNAGIYEEPWHSACSFKSKCFFIVGQTVSFICMAVCYSIHRSTCWNGSYSITSIFEWLFALFNLLFDATLWFELRYEGWAFGDWSLFGTVKSFSKSKDASVSNLLSPSAWGGSDVKSESSLEKREVLFSDSEILSSKSPYSSDAHNVHVLTILSCPSDAVMWACDTFWAYQYFGSLIHSFQHFYFQPMVDMEFTKEVLALFSFFSPVLLMVPVFRRFLTGGIPGTHRFVSWSKSSTSTIPMYVLFYFIVSLSHLQQLVSKNSNVKILSCGIAPFFLSLALVIRFLYPSSVRSDSAEVQECRRMCYAVPLGLVFEMMFRILYISQDPLYINPFYGCIFGIGGGLFFTLVLYRHAIFHEQQEKKDANNTFSTYDMASESSTNSFYSLVKSYRGISPFWLGVLNGSLVAFALLFLINPGVIPRYFAIDPFPAGVLVVLLFLLGLMCSPYLLPIASPSEGSLAHNFFLDRFFKIHQAVPAVFSILCLLFTVLMLHGTRQSNFAYSSHRYTYHEAKVSISDWKTQENFSGSKYFSFFCGLCMIFCVGILFPVAMEITWVQRRYRSDLFSKGKNLSQLPNSCKFSFGNFEFVSNAVLLFFLITFVMCLCYPFMPLGELFREGTRRMILFVVTVILFTVFVSVTRTRRVNREAFSYQSMIAQRRLPMGVVMAVLLTFIFVLYGRIVLQPEITGFQVGDSEFAAKFQPYILCMQDKLMEVTTAFNGLTDDAQSSPSRAYNTAHARNMKDSVQRTLVSEGCQSYQSQELLPLSKELNQKVLNVAEALYQFSGLIWTIHFALDNYNADSLPNMVKAIQSTGASVIGILESDLSHIQNGNRDVAEFLSYYLGFPYVDNGPVPLDGTFGCALISRYPILKVRRYILPSPLGELSCLIHATVDVMGIHVETYVGHFGNTEHDADGLLQSQFLGNLVKNNPGPSMWLGYLVTFPGNPMKYAEYSDPIKPGYFRDAAQWLYTKKTWVRLQERGGYDEIPPPSGRKIPEEEFNEFNVEAKIEGAAYLEEDLDHIDESFRATPPGKKRRTFYFNETNRYTHYHPRWEFLDRYCEYCLFKTGLKEDEKPEHWDKLQPYALQLYDWMRVADNRFIDSLSDTEIQVIKLKFVSQQK